MQNARLVVAGLPDDLVRRSFGRVDEVRSKDGESVGLDDLGRGVVDVVVGLVVLVPLVPRDDLVEVPRLPRSVLVLPRVRLASELRLCLPHFFILVQPFRSSRSDEGVRFCVSRVPDGSEVGRFVALRYEASVGD